MGLTLDVMAAAPAREGPMEVSAAEPSLAPAVTRPRVRPWRLLWAAVSVSAGEFEGIVVHFVPKYGTHCLLQT